MFELKNIYYKILFSLFITSLISILAATFFLNFGFNFISSFVFFFLLQFVGFYFYGEYVKRKNARIITELELRAAAELKKITVDVTCPCDNRIQTRIPIDTSGNNSYICGQCDKKVSVLIEAKTALKTDPIIEDSLSNPDFIGNVEKIIKDSSHNDRI